MAELAAFLPLEIGGELSPEDKAYRMLRDAVGKGGAAAPGTIEDAWRVARAEGLGVIGSVDEAAVVQAFAHLATYHIPYYEEILGIAPEPFLSEHERRVPVVEGWLGTREVSTDELQAALTAIDPRFELQAPDHDDAVTTQHGRAFEEWVPAPAYSADNTGRRYSILPNFSTDMIVVVKFDVGVGALTSDELLKLQRAKDLLNDRLASWVDFRVYTETGFIVGPGDQAGIVGVTAI
jgi:hypothetical protein